MGLTKDQVFEIIINEKSREDGGNVAQDGFSYQYACAIKEIIDRYIKNQDFLLIIEKIDDFIIVDDHMVNIFQAKNIKDKSYTVDFLTTNKNGDNSSKKTSILSHDKCLILGLIISTLLFGINIDCFYGAVVFSIPFTSALIEHLRKRT